MNVFKQYRRTNIAEMRHVEKHETVNGLKAQGVSISQADIELPADEFAKGMVARNPQNHEDQWYVAYEYFINNFEPVEVDDAI